ncbi:MAG: GntP family permease [Spirochaetaceae bacterium]|jgi:GntP family gluconate:H+ symporter|nr:GntP family permease [Spirochaetaceae bacterium]
MDSLLWLLVSFGISLAFVLAAIIKFKLHPFFALIFGGIIMGLISGLPLAKIASSLSSGFGNTMGGVGIIIVLGVVLGELLHLSGATEQIAATMLRMTGDKRAPLALNLTGFIVSIPVFFDAAFVILVNLVKSLSRRGKIPFITLVTALAVGLITTHSMIIPTPGPLTVAATLGVNIGVFIAYSIPVALIGSIVSGVLYATALGKKKEYAADYANAFEDEAAAAGMGDKPSGALGIFLIFLPIAIILIGNVTAQFLQKGSGAHSFFAFIGDKNIALLIGAVVAAIALKRYIKMDFTEVVTQCGKDAGAIFIITGAGGAFGAIINATGIGAKLVDGMSGMTGAGAGFALVLAAWVISQVLRAAQGSTTVALVTTSSIFAPLLAGLSGVSPVLVGLAICAGGIGISLPNDSGFWVVNRFSKFSLKQTIQSWTLGGSISGLTALIILLILSLFANSLPGLL